MNHQAAGLDGPNSGSRYWTAHIKALRESGLNRAEYCRRQNISYHALSYWIRKQLKVKKSELPTLVPVTISPSTPPGRQTEPESPLVVILENNYCVRVGDNFSQATLVRLLNTLEGL